MEKIIIKEYTSTVEAYIDRGFLEANGIESMVDGEYMADIYPGLPMIAPVTLSVWETDFELAKKLLEIE